VALVSVLVAFAAAYAALVAAVVARLRVLESIAVLILTYTILTWSWGEAGRALLHVFTHWVDLRVFVYMFFSMLLAGILKEKGILDLMVDSAGSIGCRFSLAAVPAMIGLMPMPGGALVSAIAMKKRYFEDAKLSREWATYLNYWFRHVWVPSWPLFQSMVITASVFAVEPTLVASHTWPATIAAIAAGAIVTAPIMAGLKCPRLEGAGVKGLLVSLSPFILVAFLAFGLHINLLYSLIITVALVAVVLRPGRRELREALKLATSPRIHAIILEALLFKNLLILTRAPQALMAALRNSPLPIDAVVYLIPFILGLSAGGETFFAATAMPLLADVIAGGSGIDWKLMLLAYTGGYLGVMASPVHLCIALTADYYKAGLGKPLALSLASIVLTTIFTVLAAPLITL
jgi:integral membrane protein (TIGR00529 family)